MMGEVPRQVPGHAQAAHCSAEEWGAVQALSQSEAGPAIGVDDELGDPSRAGCVCRGGRGGSVPGLSGREACQGDGGAEGIGLSGVSLLGVNVGGRLAIDFQHLHDWGFTGWCDG